jgi:hypothetical protein
MDATSLTLRFCECTEDFAGIGVVADAVEVGHEGVGTLAHGVASAQGADEVVYGRVMVFLHAAFMRVPCSEAKPMATRSSDGRGHGSGHQLCDRVAITPRRCRVAPF